jgi:hypothetical protein
MARKHGAYKVSYEMLKHMLNLTGDVFHVDADTARGIVRIHVNGKDAPEVPEGGDAVVLPLDGTAPERIRNYMLAYNNK